MKRLLWAGLLVGTLDITAACLQYWLTTDKNPINAVLPFVASGAFGKSAFDGSLAMKCWGLFFHYIIAFSFTAFFFALYARFIWIRNNKFISGFAYGIFIWAVTNLIVVPLSRIGMRPFDLSKAAIAAAILIGCIGLPLAYLTSEPRETLNVSREIGAH